MEMVGQFTMVEGSANRLDTEQEREQEQEQEKEVEARRDQQIEVEKFVDREFSRQEEVQRPWAFSALARPVPQPSGDGEGAGSGGGGRGKGGEGKGGIPSDYPFYHMRDFKLRHHEALEFPAPLLVSSNYFNPHWTGLRRVKNVVMVLEFAPSTDGEALRLREVGEQSMTLTDAQRYALLKAHTLLGFHAAKAGFPRYLARQDLAHAVAAFTDEQPSEELLDSIIDRYSDAKKPYLALDEFTALLVSGTLHPQHVGRYWVALSLLEAETIRRILHIRRRKDPHHVVPNASTQLALRYSPMSSPGAGPAGDCGVIFDASTKWGGKNGTHATAFEAAIAHNCYRFFDCDMHFSLPALNVLVRVLKAGVRERERFFQSTIGCRRRMELKWQETPLAKVFTVPDEWAALKQQAQAVFIVEAIRDRGLTLWEAFTIFDYDNNGILAPSEFYAALRWLGVPDLTPEDVCDFIEAADKNRDSNVEYKEYMDYLSFADEDQQDGEGEAEGERAQIAGEATSGSGPGSSSTAVVPAEQLSKVEPYGAEELREIMVRRRQAEQQQLKEERLRKAAYLEALDVKVFAEELEACRRRKGGANPAVRAFPQSQMRTGAPTPSPATTAATATTPAPVTADITPEVVTVVASPTPAPATAPTELAAAGAAAGDGDADGERGDLVRETDFGFWLNQPPLRFNATGKSSFLPIHLGTAADPPPQPMRCKKMHTLKKYSYYWMECELCNKNNTSWVCWSCYKFFCSNCYDGDRRGKEIHRRDPAQHPTFLRCLNSCCFTLQVPAAGGADTATGCYTVSMDMRFEKLPPKGHLQSLLRFSLPDFQQARKLHRTSVYLNGDGVIVGKPIETGGLVEYEEPAPVEVEQVAAAVAPKLTVAETKNATVAAGSDACAKEGNDPVYPVGIDTSSAAFTKEGSGEDVEKGTEEGKSDTSTAAASTTSNAEQEAKSEKQKKKEKKEKKKQEAKEKEEEAERQRRAKKPPLSDHVPPTILPGRWAVVTVSVEPGLRKLTVYINGKVNDFLLQWRERGGDEEP